MIHFVHFVYYINEGITKNDSFCSICFYRIEMGDKMIHFVHFVYYINEGDYKK